ncbi:hypothetical protein FISHEDRAFT_23184, partial [Fistulina hepatica ATCC 64428]
SSASTSTTPMLLTPETTGTSPEPSLPSPTESFLSPARARRQTSFYPHTNSSNRHEKPFSRSAAKRESVMALGSIEHLQHYFTKTGIAAKKISLAKAPAGLVPAIGGKSHVRGNSSLGSIELPPTPLVHTVPPPAFTEVPRDYETDPETLLPGVVDDLEAVVALWAISNRGLSGTVAPVLTTPIDVLRVLQATTRAIRSIRNYVMSLPDETAGIIRAQFRPRSLGPGTRPSSMVRSTLGSSTNTDPLTSIRRAALDVLTVLRELEERCRVPLDDEAYDAQSDGRTSRGGHASPIVDSPINASVDLPPDDEADVSESIAAGTVVPDTSFAYSLVQVRGRREPIQVWEEEDNRDSDEEEEEVKPERWDERLEVGSGWLYKQDVTLAVLPLEREVISKYLGVVDEVLFGGKKDDIERGWQREGRRVANKAANRQKARRVSMGDRHTKGVGQSFPSYRPFDRGKRRVSTGMVELMTRTKLTDDPRDMEGIREDDEDQPEQDDAESLADDDTPDWCRRAMFEDDDLGRAHAILEAHLPPNLRAALASSTNRLAFLTSLSSGQLLCVAYNACIRKSKKPWGYVSVDGIHDILALESAEDAGKEGSKTGWTFRRIDNLRLWVGAMKLRYLVPIQHPSQPAPRASRLRSESMAQPEPPVLFDAKIVARRDEGWDTMLEVALLRWMWRVVEEKRNDR